jgi:deoxycytidylate deaminase
VEHIIRELAESSPHPRYRHGAIALKGGSIVGKGYNHNGVHAEHSCLSGIWPNKRKGLVVWVGRITKSGSWAESKPCEKCEELLREARVKKVIYSTPGGFEELKYA